MILWKVPLDTRQVLPTANIEGVKEKWGFQDASGIDSQASRGLADFNNGDLANIRRVFGFTTLFQPKKSVTGAESLLGCGILAFKIRDCQLNSMPWKQSLNLLSSSRFGWLKALEQSID